MSSRWERLTRRQDFTRLFRQGKRKRVRGLALYFLLREEGGLRITFVGKSKKAVCRNRIRRRLREAFRIYYAPSWRTQPVDLLFWGDEEVCKMPFEDLCLRMGQLLGEFATEVEDRVNGED